MEEQIILVLNKYEFGLIVNALNELRTDLQKENKGIWGHQDTFLNSSAYSPGFEIQPFLHDSTPD